MEKIAVGVVAKTLTPFCYHSLAVHDGTATLPELIGDRAVAFGLAATLGMLRASVALPDEDYRKHLGALPFRTSLLITHHPELLPPLVRRLNLDDEGGYQENIRAVAAKGNLATYFQTQEVPHGKEFRGAIFGYNPFQATGREHLVIRIGLHRNGMVLLQRDDSVTAVRLNAATAALFGCPLALNPNRPGEKAVERYCLHNLQVSREYALEEALEQVMRWG